MIDVPDIAGLAVALRQGDEVEINVGSACDEAAFLRLLFWLPPGCELAFYDQYFPGSRGDPGAYVDVQRKDNWFKYHMGNHGWFQPWTTQSPELLVAWLALNLKANLANPEPLRRMRIRENVRLAQGFE